MRFTAEGLDGKSAEKTFSVAVSGSVILPPPRRYSETREYGGHAPKSFHGGGKSFGGGHSHGGGGHSSGHGGKHHR